MGYNPITIEDLVGVEEVKLSKFIVKIIMGGLDSKTFTNKDFQYNFYEQQKINVSCSYNPIYRTKDLFDLFDQSDDHDWIEKKRTQTVNINIYIEHQEYDFMELEIHFNDQGNVLVNVRGRDKGMDDKREQFHEVVESSEEFLEKFIFESCLETLNEIKEKMNISNTWRGERETKKANSQQTRKPETTQNYSNNKVGEKKMNIKAVTFGFLIILIIWDVLTTYYGTYQIFTLGGKSNTDNNIIYFVSGLFAVGIIVFILSYRTIFRANNGVIKTLLVVIFIYDFTTSIYGTGQAINMDYQNYAQWAIVLLLSIMTTAAPILMSYLKDEDKI